VLDLKLLAGSLAKRLIVGHLGDQAPDDGPESPLELLEGRLGVLHRVVKQGRDQQRLVGGAPLHGQNRGHGERVVDERGTLGIFASLVAVLLGGKGRGPQQRRGIGGKCFHRSAGPILRPFRRSQSSEYRDRA